jgi:hypothetical protein
MFVILSYDNGSVKEKLMNVPKFLRRRPKVWVPAILLMVLPAIMITRVSSDGESGVTNFAYVVLALVSIVVVVTLVQIARMFAGVDPEVPQLAQHLASDPDQQRLLTRWMLRARRARNIGGICGVIVWVLGTSLQGDLLLCGVGGIALGAMLAELHVVRRQKGPRTATLDVRAVADYLTDRDRNRMLAVVAAALVMVATAVTVDGVDVAAWSGLAALFVLGAAHLVQRRVASRPRPAIAASLRHADDLARELAIGRGLAQPATYFGLALLARSAFALRPEVGDIAVLLGVAAWICALVLWWSNRRLGLDFLLEQRQPALA